MARQILPPRLIATSEALFSEADAFLVDQFGTLHDGARPYPGVIDRLRQMRRAGKPVIILSNSGKRSEANAERLAAIGLGADCYDAVLTSGEAAWRILAQRQLPWLATARRCLVLARGGDPAALAGLDLEAVTTAGQADFILLLGSEADRIGLAGYRALLAPAVAARLPCLCANPDLEMILPDGRTAPAPGAIAALYAEMGGGPITLIGKPAPAIYDAAFTLLESLTGHPADRARIWAVGDSLDHDIAGAAAAGCRSLLVGTGLAAGMDAASLAERLDRTGGISPEVFATAL